MKRLYHNFSCLLILIALGFMAKPSNTFGQITVALTAQDSTLCAGSSTLLTATVTGGSGSHVFTWMNGAQSDSSTALVTPTKPAIYGVKVRDLVSGERDSTNIAITLLPEAKASFTVPATCEGSASAFTDNSSLATFACSPDLFFSEYIEGSGNNKALEIYNGTGKDVDLKNYRINKYSNGSNAPGNFESQILNTYILPDGGTYVIANGKATINTLLTASQDTNSGLINHNGNDAFGLFNPNGVMIDVFGVIGQDPGTNGWLGSGSMQTKDRTLVRKPSIVRGIVNNPTTFNPSDEWIEYPKDTTQYIGSHTMTCTQPTIAAYTWRYGDGLTSDTMVTHNYSYAAPGTLTSSLTVSTSNGCLDSTTNAAVVNVMPFATVSITGDTTFCVGDSVILTSAFPTNNQWWKSGVAINGATGTTYVAKESGNFQVIVTNNCGTAASRNIKVTQIANPTVNLAGNNTLCSNTTSLFTADAGFSSYAWILNTDTVAKDTAQYNYIPGNDGDDLGVVVTNAQGCKNSDAISMTIYSIPSVTIMGRGNTIVGIDSLCSTDSVVYSLQGNFATQAWYIKDTVKVSTTANYTYNAGQSGDEIKVVVTSNDGCKDSTIIRMEIAGVVEAGANEFACFKNLVSYQVAPATPSGGIWSSSSIKIDANDGTLDLATATTGVYTVRYTVGKCFDSKNVNLVETKAPEDFFYCVNGGTFQLTDITPASPLGGTWSGNGIVNADSGKIDPLLLTGIQSYVYTYQGCSDSTQVTYGDRLGATTIVCHDSSRTTNSVRFDWTAIPGATSYWVKVGSTTASKINDLKLYVTGLSQGAPVSIKVWADNPGCLSDTASSSCTSLTCIPFSTEITSTKDSICKNESVDVVAKVTGGVGPFKLSSYNIILSDTGTIASNVPDTNVYYGVLIADLGQKNSNGNPGCPAATDSVYVTVLPLPKAKIYADISMANETGAVSFWADSIGVSNYAWNFGDPNAGTSNLSVLQKPTHTFETDAEYTIWLKVLNQFGCADSSSKVNVKLASGVDTVINIIPIIRTNQEVEVYFPNIFSPNGDGKNDNFTSLGGTVTTMDLEIYNRWGEQIFKTTNSSTGWDGKKNDGTICDIGTYIYSAIIVRSDGKEEKVKGMIVLVK